MNLPGATGRVAAQAVPPILPIAALLVMWELAGRFGLVNVFLASMPSRVVTAIVEMATEGPLLTDVLTTVRLLFVAYGVSVVLGVVLGMLAGFLRKFEYGFSPLIWFFYNAPIVAFIPLLMLWFGLGGPTIFVLGLLFGFFPIYVNTASGIENVDPVLMRLGRSFCLKRWEMAWKIVLPAALPIIFAGFRLAMGRVFVGIIVGEIFAGSRFGLGFRLRNAADRLQTDESFAALVVIAVMAVLIGTVLRRLDERFSAWRMVGN